MQRTQSNSSVRNWKPEVGFPRQCNPAWQQASLAGCWPLSHTFPHWPSMILIAGTRLLRVKRLELTVCRATSRSVPLNPKIKCQPCFCSCHRSTCFPSATLVLLPHPYTSCHHESWCSLFNTHQLRQIKRLLFIESQTVLSWTNVNSTALLCL